METAVAFQIFDRPEETRRVFGEIARAQPKRLFVFADGPRSPAEARLCEHTRAVVSDVSWDCHAEYDFSDVNLGCGRRLASGLDWVFSEVDELIFLEDDDLPDPSFFPFCETMLDHYRDDPTVLMVSGCNYLQEWHSDCRDYHLSHLGSPWGVALWKRAWALYDDGMGAWSDPDVRERIRVLLDDDEVFAYEAARFDRVLAAPENPHLWDLAWMVARLAAGGTCVVPATNLIQNLGNTGDRGVPSTHPLAQLRRGSVRLPVRFNSDPLDREYDHLHVERQIAWWRTNSARTLPASPPQTPIKRAVPLWLKRLAHRARKQRGVDGG